MNHEHKYFIFSVKTVFEPEGDLYRAVEYAVLGCNCGDVIKQRVKVKD